MPCKCKMDTAVGNFNNNKVKYLNFGNPDNMPKYCYIELNIMVLVSHI